jgi:hypothetical protein
MCRPGIKGNGIVRAGSRLIAVALGAATLGAILGGCSDTYLDGRDSISLGAGDAIAANEVEQTIDPWPAWSGNTNIAANGQRMQSAVEHYRTNTEVQPIDPMLLENSNPSTPTAQNNSQTQATTTLAPASIQSGTPTTSTAVVTAAPSQ